MKLPTAIAKNLRVAFITASLMLLAPPAAVVRARQSPDSPPQSAEPAPQFRLERTGVAGGAELLTIWGRVVAEGNGEAAEETPLLSVLRDTLGDGVSENDLLREVWVHTYARPGLLQRAAALVPFMYRRVPRGPRPANAGAPPPIIDLSDIERDVWNRLFVSALKGFIVDGQLFNASMRGYGRNLADYRQGQVSRALTILSLYEASTGAAPTLTPAELRKIQGRLMMTGKTLGGMADENILPRVYEKQTRATLDLRGHNWELLRQQAEVGGLHFEPLEMPDGSATHALLWVAKADLSRGTGRRYKARFLNIKNPWGDARLSGWRGYAETKYFDDEGRPVPANAAGARAAEMIPLALYGLDFANIPLLLVDFRDGLNPAKRELSRRVIDDLARDVLSVSRFGNLYYLLGRAVFDFATSRRGMDINRPSRLRSGAQLKLLLSLNPKLDPGLREEISGRLELISLNPLEQDARGERKLALAQYRALLAYAARPDGLPARLARERREELTKFNHGGRARTFLRLANVLTLGRYTHREKSTPENLARLDEGRQLAFHTRLLREVTKSSPVVEVVFDIEEVRRSLRFVAEHGEAAGAKTARAVAEVFSHTEDGEAKRLCLSGLKLIGNKVARAELLRIYQDEGLGDEWRTLIAEYLKLPGSEAARGDAEGKRALSDR
jgi:hypothetical protein